MHWSQPLAWLHSLFVHHQSPDGRGTAAFIPPFQYQYHQYFTDKYLFNWHVHLCHKQTINLVHRGLVTFSTVRETLGRMNTHAGT